MNAEPTKEQNIDRSEFDRERDLHKYYQPWLDSTKPKVVPTDDETEQCSTPNPSHDTTLTALAQLAALRLNVKRAMVSLISSDVQMVLAEATQTLSLVDETSHAPGDHVWLGQVSLPREDWVDEHVFGSIWSGQSARGQSLALSALVINDLAEDDRFKHKSYVTATPGVRFYAGVPIITNCGHEIGVCAVSDTKPHPEGLSVDQVLFMQDLSHIITSHLERVRATVDNRREEGFVRSMHSFIEGVSILKHDLNDSAQEDMTNHQTHSPLQATDPQNDFENAGHEGHEEKLEVSRADHATSHPGMTDDSTDGVPEYRTPRYFTETDTPTKELTGTSDSSIRTVFQRAANCMREAIDAQGCVFFDASCSAFSTGADGVLSRSTSSSRRPPTPTDQELGLFDEAASADELDENAKVLGMAMANHLPCTLNEDMLKRRQLQICLSRYPHGQYFHMQDGVPVPASSGIVDEDQTRIGRGTRADRSSRRSSQQRQRHQRTILPRLLLDHLAGAKWLVFLPLFNHARGQWYAGAFLWSDRNDVHNIEGIMSYFKTFGSCLMSEVTSLEAFNVSLAKSNFVMSISHDLRSPLHGMLGSLEFLEDTMTSAYQLSLLGSIETCGKTLLDTIDHLLDYAKINNLNRTASETTTAHVSGTNVAVSKLSEQQASSFDFGVLLEEVVEAVFAGQTFRKTRLRAHDQVDELTSEIQSIELDDSTNTDEQIHAGSAKFSGKVFFILDINNAKSWCLKGQTGGIRRIIMNVVGNAIKYCNEGCIEIVLCMQNQKGNCVDVEISVKDTGIGMSQKFLENHLFKAFSQEDPFAPGAGLGLSIASQIVQTLHGKIRVHSEKGLGTHVNISLPMEISSASCGHEEILAAVARSAKGKSICLLNPHSKSGAGSEQLSKLTASIARTCEEWFGMQCRQSGIIEDDDEASIFVYCEPPPIEFLLKHHAERKANGKGGKEAALLIICTNAFEAAALRAAGIARLVSLGRIVEVISQPVGARKLAKVILSSLQRVEGLKSPAFSQKPSDTGTGERKPYTIPDKAQQRASEIGWNSTSIVYDEEVSRHRPSIEAYRWKSDRPLHTEAPTTLKESQTDFSDTEAGRSPSLVNTEHKDVATKDETASSPSVLLVDDNAINLKLLVAFMKKIRLPYSEAVDGLDAFNKYKDAEKPYDYVLMDLQMPVMDGMESTRKIRELEKERKVSKQSTIIAITGVGNESVRREALDAGMSQYLTKPVKFKALHQMLEQHLQASKP